ncbi:RHS repeat-associated core domain-containing protein [Escherichia coli]|uniref:RHS repeat-associated core domain-containing protein n=1 Tax=Shewanella xiamenensis TaxID=332186 RepID=UPI003B8E9AAD
MKWINVICTLILFALPAQAATVRYQHTDMLGSVVSESDESGNIISRSQYEPFGKRMGGDKEGIGYTGHLQDKDLGLTYMQARYYDPLIGRFYSNDPVDALGHIGRGNPAHGFNRYAYANNNPYKYVDPDGEWALQAIGALVGGYTSYQSVKNSNMSNMEKAMHVLGGAAVGAVTASLSGVKALKTVGEGLKAALGSSGSEVAGQVAKGAVVGAVSGAATQVATDAVTGQEVTIEKTAMAAAEGTLMGAGTTVIGPVLVGESSLGVAVSTATTVVVEKIKQSD